MAAATGTTYLSHESTAFSLRGQGRTQLALSTSLFHETRVSHAWVCHHIRDPRFARRHFGFVALAGTLAVIAKVLLFVFLALFVISLIFGRRWGPAV